MKYADINRRYTEIVAEWLAKGYTINAGTMGDSQGETAKVDLTNGHEIIRILVQNFTENEIYYLSGEEIIVGRYEGFALSPNEYYLGSTIWNNKLNILSRDRFYKLGLSKDGNPFYGTKAEAEGAAKREIERYIRASECSKPKSFTSDKAKKIAKRVIRREFGAKRICEPDIKVFTCVSGNQKAYCVSYKDRTYRLS
jgi:hypothetical protein